MRHSITSPQKPNIARFHRRFEKFQLDTDALYQQLGLKMSVMSADNSSISMDKYFQLLELAAVQSGDRFLSARMALDSQNQDVGILGYMLRSAENFEQAIELLHRYVMLVSPGASTSLIEQDDQCILTYKIHNATPEQSRQDVEGTIVQFVLMVRQVFNDDTWQPDLIYFEHPSTDEDESAFPLDTRIVYGHFFNGLCFPKSLLSASNQQYDPQLLTLLEEQVQQTAEHLLTHNTLMDHVRLLISSNLGQAGVSADSVAQELGMSRSTLHRRLRDNGTSFNTLRETIVFQIAKESLSNSTVSITELAQQLGYSDSSAFDRAFKRMAKVRPLEYRNRHKN